VIAAKGTDAMLVYLLCFAEDGGLHNRGRAYATHYTGWTEGSAEDRLEAHLTGQGSPLVRAVAVAGQRVTVARVWRGASRSFERLLKNQKHAPSFCPLCVEAGRADERTPPDPIEAG
jgi:hypothetical protein